MKEFKINYGGIITLLVMCGIFLVVGVVFALLPESVYIGWGDDNPQMTRFYPLIAAGIFDIIFCPVAYVVYVREKKFVAKANELMHVIGSEAIALTGLIKDPQEERENAAKTAISVIGGFLSALILGFGVYKIYGKNNKRHFILFPDGLCVIDAVNNTQAILNRETANNMTVTQKRNKLLVKFPSEQLYIVIKTNGLDISQDQLAEKFAQTFSIPAKPEEKLAYNVYKKELSQTDSSCFFALQIENIHTQLKACAQAFAKAIVIIFKSVFVYKAFQLQILFEQLFIVSNTRLEIFFRRNKGFTHIGVFFRKLKFVYNGIQYVFHYYSILFHFTPPFIYFLLHIYIISIDMPIVNRFIDKM